MSLVSLPLPPPPPPPPPPPQHPGHCHNSSAVTEWSPEKKIEIGVLKLLEFHWNGQFYHYHDILYHFKYLLRSYHAVLFGAQSAHGVFVKTGQCLLRYCMPYVCWQLYCKGKRIWMFAQTNWLKGLNYLPSIKDENDNDAVALRLFRKR